MSRDEIAEKLREIGARRTAAIEARNVASTEIAPVIRAAKAAGMTYAEIVELSGVSKQGVYDFLRASP
jgi:predicted transcriptional regulator